MKQTYVKGFYGNKNIGDDIFTVTAKWVFDNYFLNTTPVFIGKNLPLMPNGTKLYKTKYDFTRRLVELYILLRAETVLYYGGSILTNGGNSFFDIKYLLRRVPLFSKKMITIGTSIGPFKNGKDYTTTHELLSKFSGIGVRDYSSLEVLNKMKLESKSTFTFDNAILLTDVFPNIQPKKTKKSNEIKIGVSVCRYESYNNLDKEKEIKREKTLIRTLDAILNKYEIDEIVFFEFNGSEKTGDKEVTQEFRSYFKGKVKTTIIEYSPNTEDFLIEINKCDFMLGVRLHSSIIAYALKIPFMLVEYHDKCTEFLNTINHNFRFDDENYESNMKCFDEIASHEAVPEIIEPEYFKKIMKEELNRMATFFN